MAVNRRFWSLRGFYRVSVGPKNGRRALKHHQTPFLKVGTKSKNLGCIDFFVYQLFFAPPRVSTGPRGMKKGEQNENFGSNLWPRVSSYSKCKKLRYHLVTNFYQEFPCPSNITSPFSLPQTSQKSQNYAAGHWLFW